jgi:hypothetical protein
LERPISTGSKQGGWSRARKLSEALRAVSPAEWLLLALSMVLTWRYFWLMDDAFVDFRYVDNALFLGRGLVFNSGEYVEGFSSPAWVLLLMPLRALGFSYWAIVRGVALVAAALFGVFAIAVNRRLSPPSAPVVNVPLALSAGHYGILSSFSSGLETPFVQLSAAVYGLAALAPSSRVLQLLLGLTPCVRPELALPCLLMAGWHIIVRRRVPWMLLGSLLLWNGGWLLFRVYYYADFFPNTFHLKARSDWQQGFYYFCNAFDPLHIVLAALLTLAWTRLRRALPDPGGARALMLLCAGSVALWVIRIGGDMIYFRFMAFAFCLALLASGGIAEGVLGSLPGRGGRRSLAAVTALVVAALSFASYPGQLQGHPLSRPETRKIHDIADAMWHRKHSGLADATNPSVADAKRKAAYAVASPAQRNPSKVFVTGWCKAAYDHFDQYVVHDYGLTEAVLARLDAPFGRPGHKLVQGNAAELAMIYSRYGHERGVFRRAAAQRRTPRWIRRNLEPLELIERKIYNRHDLFENLRLALTPVGHMQAY